MRNHVPGIGRLICCALAFGACAKTENRQRSTDSASAAALMPETTARAMPAVAMLSYADVAGKWNMRSVPEDGSDTMATTYVLTATSDSAGWKLTFPNGLSVPARVSMGRDSVVLEAGPYASVRRKGMQVTTHGSMRRQGDRLVGYTVARYKTTRPDSVLRLRTEGMRAP